MGHTWRELNQEQVGPCPPPEGGVVSLVPHPRTLAWEPEGRREPREKQQGKPGKGPEVG